MKLENMEQWMKEQGVEEDVSEFISCFTQEKLDSFGDCPVIAVACMWEGWKLAKQAQIVDKSEMDSTVAIKGVLSAGDVAYLHRDLQSDGYPFSSYGFDLGDEVTVLGYEVVDSSVLYDVALSRDKRRKIRVSEQELGVKDV